MKKLFALLFSLTIFLFTYAQEDLKQKAIEQYMQSIKQYEESSGIKMDSAVIAKGLEVIEKQFNGTNSGTSTNPYTSTVKDITSAGDTVGVYCQVKGKWKAMDPINTSGQKINALATAFTYGIAKTKIKNVFEGETSPYVFEGGKAKFRFYFGVCPASKAARYYMFTGNYTMRDFSVSKFEVKRKQRRLSSGSVSLWTGVDTGTQRAEGITMNTDEIRDGVYDVEIEGEPGEYCFTFSINGTGAYTTVFDFTLK